MKSKVLFTLFLVTALLIATFGSAFAQDDPQSLPLEGPETLDLSLEPSLSADGLTVYNAIPPLVVTVDNNPAMRDLKFPQDPDIAAAINGETKGAATFSITYVASGGTDLWGEPCYTFPNDAKTAFNAAAAIWAANLSSTVPITIKACWANLGSSSILGYSGGAPAHRDFSGAPKAGTWYEGSIANSLHGSDLAAGQDDMNITYNSGFSWYTGTDGNPPAGTYDLVTVAAHEIAHGLNFSGSASKSGSNGYWGSSGYPYIYDTFMEDGAGTKLTSYTSGSTALGTLLTSGNLWFDGTNANAANGGGRVKMYAPGTWAGGSSYSHLDYSTFAGTTNSMMVYAVSSGAAQHNPGPVTIGLFKDLGWSTGGSTPTVPTPKAPSGTITDKTPTYKWSKITGATKYQFRTYKGSSTTPTYTKEVTSSACGTTDCTNTPGTTLSLASYKWQARAYVGGAWKAWSSMKSFTVSGGTTGWESTFSSNASGWTKLNGSWSVSGGYYKSPGLYDKFVTSKHDGTYSILTYTVKMKRTGCASCAMGIFINGSPSPITSTGRWNNGYAFYIYDGYYQVGYYSGGTWYTISDWVTYSVNPLVSNTLQVTYNKNTGFCQFYINGSRVGYGPFNTFKSGVVGVGFYQNATSTFFVDNAKLSMSAPSSLRADDDAILFDESAAVLMPEGSELIAP